MSRTTVRNPDVIGGVDCHADTHEAAVLTANGRLPATARFAATPQGYRRLLRWMAGLGIDRPHGQTAFAHMCATDPIPASCGKPNATDPTPAATAKPTALST
jgi:hypothetical protein